VKGQLHASAVLPRYTFDMRLEQPQNRCGPATKF